MYYFLNIYNFPVYVDFLSSFTGHLSEICIKKGITFELDVIYPLFS